MHFIFVWRADRWTEACYSSLTLPMSYYKYCSWLEKAEIRIIELQIFWTNYQSLVNLSFGTIIWIWNTQIQHWNSNNHNHQVLIITISILSLHITALYCASDSADTVLLSSTNICTAYSVDLRTANSSSQYQYYYSISSSERQTCW